MCELRSQFLPIWDEVNLSGGGGVVKSESPHFCLAKSATEQLTSLRKGSGRELGHETMCESGGDPSRTNLKKKIHK